MKKPAPKSAKKQGPHIDLTIAQLLNAGPVVRSLSGQKFWSVSALRILRMATKLAPELQAAEAARDSLFNDDNSVAAPEIGPRARRLKDECIDEFIQSPLFAEVISVDVTPLKPSDIADAKISAEEILRLGPLFVDEE